MGSKKFKYMLVYNFEGGTGRMFVTIDKKLDTHKAIEEMDKFISNDQNVENVFITNIIELKG